MRPATSWRAPISTASAPTEASFDPAVGLSVVIMPGQSLHGSALLSTSGSTGFVVWSVVSAAVYAGLFLLCVFRFGLLSVVGGLLSAVLSEATLTTRLSDWYAGPAMLMLGLLVALGVWAFYVSLAGRPLFKDSLLDGG